MAAKRSDSILAVDFGNVHTRGMLIDLVEGAYRVVAQGETRTTAGFPAGNVAVGLRRVVSQLEQVTGRRFQDAGGRVITPEQADLSGVDLFLATASIGRPLRTVLIGLVPDVSVASGLRAVAGTYVQVVETINLADRRTEEEHLNAIVAGRPDLIFITGGLDAGAAEPVLRLARVAALALPLLRGQQTPGVLFAGNADLVPALRGLFDGLATLFIAPNVRPTLDDETLDPAQMQLALAFDAASSRRGTGFEAIGAMSRMGILPTAQSYNLILDYLGQAQDGGVVALDIGSGVGTLSASLRGQTETVIRTDVGVGHSARSLLETVGADALRAWIPFYTGDDELAAYALNKGLRPGGVPETVRELYLEYAFLRLAARELARAARPLWDRALGDLRDEPLPPFERMIGAGAGLTQTGRPGLTAMLLLDALAPQGVTTLYRDPGAVVPALGALAHVNPAAVVQVLESNGLERLGVAFSLNGQPRAGRVAMRVKITVEGSGQTIRHDVEGGQLWVYPMSSDVRARVEISTRGRGVSIGGKTRLKLDLPGGTAGLIFDARGRPLLPAADLRARAAQLPLWLSQVTGDAIHTIDERWLQPSATAPRQPAQSANGRSKTAAEPPAKRERRPQPEKKSRRTATAGRDKRQPEPARADESDEMDELRDLFS